MERTFVMVKPDGVQRGLIGEIVGRFERRGLKIVGMKMVQVSDDLARRHYAVHEGKPFFAGLISYITSAPVVAMVVEGTNAVVAVRQTVGALGVGGKPELGDRRPGAGDRPQPRPRQRCAGNRRRRDRPVVWRGRGRVAACGRWLDL